MKKILKTLSLIAASVMMAVACMEIEPVSSTTITSDDDSLSGETVQESNEKSVFYKMFVLNEGQMGVNNASLDFLRYTNGKYVRNAFAQMNPSITLGLGDVANDIKFFYNTAWICLTNSGILQVINAIHERVIKTFDIPGCRQVTFSGNYAYVTSYAGAVYGGDAVKGRLYRINLETFNMDYIEVGYQPEGVAAFNGYIYVVNGGGYMPGYGNTISVISEATFTVYKEIEIVSNPDDIYIDVDGNIWVTSPGDYYSTHSGLYLYKPEVLTPINTLDIPKVRISASYCTGTHIFAVGSEDEWNWSGPKAYNLYVIDCKTKEVAIYPFSGEMNNIQVPYAVAYNPYTLDYYITDAGDYVNPGFVYCFDQKLNFKWKTTAGVNPGHMEFYYYYNN